MYNGMAVIQDENGLVSRSAAFFIQKANEFASMVWLEHENRRVNAKSLLGVLSLNIRKNQQVTLIADGRDEVEAVKSLVEAIETNFAKFF